MATQKSFTAFRSNLEKALQSLRDCAEKNGDSTSKFFCYLCRQIFFAYDNFYTEVRLLDKKNIKALKKNLTPVEKCEGKVSAVFDAINFDYGSDWTELQKEIIETIISLYQLLNSGALNIEVVEVELLKFNKVIKKW